MNTVIAAVALVAPYFSTSEAIHIGLTDKQRAINVLRPINENIEKEAASFVETLRRLEKICTDHDLSKTQTIKIGVKGLVDSQDYQLPNSAHIPIRGYVYDLEAMPVTVNLVFTSKTGQPVSEARIMLVFGRFKDGWRLADIEVIN